MTDLGPPRKPAGVTVVGVGLLVFAGMLGLASLVLAVLSFGSTTDERWVTISGATVGAWLSLVGIGVAFNLLGEPAVGRRRGEIAMWIAVPVSWAEMASVAYAMGDGQFDLFLAIFFGGSAFGWSAVFVAGALYMRSLSVIKYFESVAPTDSS